MVVQRTIEELRQRPKEDRRAIAVAVAVGFAGVVFIAWTFYFMQVFKTGEVTSSTQQAYTATVGAVFQKTSEDNNKGITVNGIPLEN